MSSRVTVTDLQGQLAASQAETEQVRQQLAAARAHVVELKAGLRLIETVVNDALIREPESPT